MNAEDLERLWNAPSIPGSDELDPGQRLKLIYELERGRAREIRHAFEQGRRERREQRGG